MLIAESNSGINNGERSGIAIFILAITVDSTEYEQLICGRNIRSIPFACGKWLRVSG